MTSPSLSKIFPSPTIEASSQKLYHDETELLSDSCITKTLSKEVEAVPVLVRKVSNEDLDVCVEVSSRKLPKDTFSDTSLEMYSGKIPKEDSPIEMPSRKTSQDRMDLPTDVTVRRGLVGETDVEFPSRKVEKDSVSELMDTPRNVYRERSDLPVDKRKVLWNDLDATDKQVTRNISRDMLGTSFDSTTRKLRDEAEHLFDSVSRRFARDSISIEIGSRKLSRNKGERSHDSSVRALAADKSVDATITPRRISRDEMEYGTGTGSLKILPREKFDKLMDTSSFTEKPEFVLEPPTRRLLRNESDPSAGSFRRTTRMSRDVMDSSEDITAANIWDKGDIPMEISKQSALRELDASELDLSPDQFGQPDLMVTSQVQRTTSDLYTVGPLSQLVYDGILEKSCHSVASLSTSTTYLSQKSLLADVEPPLPAPRVAVPSSTAPSDSREEKSKDKEKSKKSMKLKSIFKKKPESTTEKPQSGLHKL